MEIFRIVILALSGLLLTFVGSMRLANPVKSYLKNSGISLGSDVNLLNEMRGVGAFMMMAGITTLLGTFIPQLTIASLVVALLVFLGFAIGRIISMRADGKPNKLIIQGLIFELVLGPLSAIGLATLLA